MRSRQVFSSMLMKKFFYGSGPDDYAQRPPGGLSCAYISNAGMRVLCTTGKSENRIMPKSDAIRDFTQPNEGLRLGGGSSRAVVGDHLAAKWLHTLKHVSSCDLTITAGS